MSPWQSRFMVASVVLMCTLASVPQPISAQFTPCTTADFFPLMFLPEMTADCVAQFVGLAATATSAGVPDDRCLLDKDLHCDCLTLIPASVMSDFNCHLHKGCNETVHTIYKSCPNETSVVTPPVRDDLVALLKKNHTPYSYTLITQIITLSGLNLSVAGPFTILAATDAATETYFEANPELLAMVTAFMSGQTGNPTNQQIARIVSLIAHHVIRGNVSFTLLKEETSKGCGLPISTENGDFVNFCIDTPQFRVESSGTNTMATVVQPDLFASNGVAHGIDKVLEPSPLPDRPLNGSQCTHPQDVNLLLGHGVDHVTNEITVAIDKAAAVCVAGGFDCIQQRMESLGYTPNCSMCFEKYGWCGLGSCVRECIDSTTAPACVDCTRRNCLAGLVNCSGQPSEIFNAINGTTSVPTLQLLEDMQGDFSSLDRLLIENNIKPQLQALQGNDKFTIFAPTNDAFADPYTRAYIRYLEGHQDLLTRFLLGLVVSGTFGTSNLFNASQSFYNLNNVKISFSSDNATTAKSASILNGQRAKITIPNMYTANGVVHGVGSALLAPPCNTTDEKTMKHLSVATIMESTAPASSSCGLDCVSLQWMEKPTSLSVGCSICVQLLTDCAIKSCSCTPTKQTLSQTCRACITENCGVVYTSCTRFTPTPTTPLPTPPPTPTTTAPTPTATATTAAPSTEYQASSSTVALSSTAVTVVIVGVVLVVFVLVIIAVLAVLLIKKSKAQGRAQRENYSNPLYNNAAVGDGVEPEYAEPDTTTNTTAATTTTVVNDYLDVSSNTDKDAGYMEVPAANDTGNYTSNGNGYMDVSAAHDDTSEA